MVSLAGLADWQAVATVRAFVAFVLALGLVRLAGAEMVYLRPRALWLRSVAGSGSMVLTFYALAHMPLADALTLTHTFPLWVAVLTWPLLGRRPPAGVWPAIACGLVGVALVERPHLSAGNLAALAALLAAVCTAFAMIGLNQLRGLDTRAVVAHFSGVLHALQRGRVGAAAARPGHAPRLAAGHAPAPARRRRVCHRRATLSDQGVHGRLGRAHRQSLGRRADASLLRRGHRRGGVRPRVRLAVGTRGDAGRRPDGVGHARGRPAPSRPATPPRSRPADARQKSAQAGHLGALTAWVAASGPA